MNSYVTLSSTEEGVCVFYTHDGGDAGLSQFLGLSAPLSSSCSKQVSHVGRLWAVIGWKAIRKLHALKSRLVYARLVARVARLFHTKPTILPWNK